MEKRSGRYTDHRHLVGETIPHRTIRVKERFGQISGCPIKEIGRAQYGFFDVCFSWQGPFKVF